MSGYNSNTKSDPCSARFEEELDNAVLEYTLYAKAHTRAGVSPSTNLSVAQGRDSYGPKDRRVHMLESFLQGRGQVTSECAECEVIHLPAVHFDKKQETDRPEGFCARADLQRQYTRVPKSANSLSEVDISEYSRFPGAYQTGWAAPGQVVDTQIQTRMAVLSGPRNACGKRSSYASYGLDAAGSGRYGQGAYVPRYGGATETQ